MSRYTGPRVKKMRALGVNLPGLSPKTNDKRPYPPGQHGQRRRKITEYGRRLAEKQKLRYNYGVTEHQLRRLMTEAKRAEGATGHKLIEFLERRLDNVVFRANLARTIPGARQLVAHGHILVNGKRLDIPSYRVKAGDVISLRERSKDKTHVKAALENPTLIRPDWIEFDSNKNAATVKVLPDETSIPFEMEVQLVVEYYSKRL